MKVRKTVSGILCSAALLLTAVVPPAASSLRVEAETGGEQQAPLMEVFNQPATDWASEALPLGNGFLGAMVFGGVDSDRIQVNEHSLWSGGPGANAAYNGGNGSSTAEQNHANLQAARAELQQVDSDFTKNSSAYIDPNTGKVVSQDYPAMSAALSNEINALRGDKSNFGAYQTLGNITLDDPDHPTIKNITSNSAHVASQTASAPASMFDGNISTKWCSIAGQARPFNQPFPVWVIAEYNEPLTFLQYTLTSAEDMPARDPKSWTLYGSDDGASYQVIDSRTNVSFANRNQSKTFALAAPVSYRFIKFEITDILGDGTNDKTTIGTQLAELSFSAAPTTAGYVALTTNSANTAPASSPDAMFDGNTTSKWCSIAGLPKGTPQPFPAWVTTQYAAPITFKQYTLTSGEDVPGRDPKNWTLYGSNDGTNYDVIDTRQDVAFSARKQAKTFTLASPASYRYIKFEVSATFGGVASDGVQLSELSYDQDGAYTAYKRTLNLDDSVARVSYQQDGVNFTRDYWVSSPGNFMAIRLTADKAGAISRIIGVDTPQTNHTVTAAGDTITMTGQPADQQADGLKFAQQIKVIPEGGSMAAKDGTITVQNADSFLLLMTAGTNYQMSMNDSFDYFSDEDPLTAVSQRLDQAAAQSYDALLAAHTQDYQSLFSRVKLNLGATALPDKTTDALVNGYAGTNTAEEDRYLETLYYQFGRYLLIASSREGSLPANLQGIWSDSLSPIWNSDYHTNINLEMNYWLSEETNLSETHDPMIQYINSLVPRGTQTAQLFHVTEDGGAVRGWTTYHEVNIWGNTGPSNTSAFYFPTGAAWLCDDIWQQYAFTQNKQKLSQNYNTLLQAALFWVDNLVTDTRDGTLVVSPSRSPEHGAYSLGDTSDQEIVWQLFEDTLKASAVLSKDTPEVADIRAAQAKLSGPKIGLAGQFQEWKDEVTTDITGDNHYRHIAQLFSLQPGDLIIPGRSAQDDAFAEAMKVTLNTRGDDGVGWSQAWKINLWARLRDGNRAGELVKDIISQSTQSNLFDSCNGYTKFQIDGNFGATAGMTEMLLQSQGDAIDLLPAVSDSWSSGSVAGLKARGDVEVGMNWQNKTLTSVKLQPGASSTLKVKGTGIGSLHLADSSGKGIRFTKIDANTISFDAKAGESYTLSATVPTVDKSQLQSLVSQCDALDANGYTQQSFAALAAPLQDAKTLLGGDDLYQDDVDAAYSALLAAFQALTPRAGKTALNQAVADALKLDTSLYYPDTSFAQTLVDAQRVQADPDATDAEVQASVSALNAAAAALRRIPDTSRLRALVETAQAKAAASYTADSAQKLTEALAAAQTLLKGEPDEAQVAGAADALNSALEGLVPVKAAADSAPVHENDPGAGSQTADEPSAGTDSQTAGENPKTGSASPLATALEVAFGAIGALVFGALAVARRRRARRGKAQ